MALQEKIAIGLMIPAIIGVIIGMTWIICKLFTLHWLLGYGISAALLFILGVIIL